MKVRLVQPAQLNDHGRPIRHKKLFFPSVTLPTVAALTPSGIDVGITNEYVEDVDFDERVDLVGITAQTCHAPRAYQIADEFRKRGTRTIMGGIHASARPDEALQHFDSVLIGEAENLWEQILADARDGCLKSRYIAHEKPDLARLVIPRFDLIDFKKYVMAPLAKTPLITIQTSRGCPNACDFCSVSGFFGQKIRSKPTAHVIREIETVEPSRVFFTDDNIGANPSYAAQLFSALKPLRLRWACQMSTTIGRDPKLIEAAAEAGCHETLIGLESLNPRNLAAVHKGFNRIEEYKTLLKRMADVGILAQVSVIFGLDEDTVDDLRRMIDTLLEWDINYIYVAILTPFPGTRLHDRFEAQGRLRTTDLSSYDGAHVVFEPTKMSGPELDAVVWEMFARCYSARNIFRRVWRFKRQYTAYFPRDNALEEIFLQLYMRNAIRRKNHPFSLGPQEKRDDVGDPSP